MYVRNIAALLDSYSGVVVRVVLISLHVHMLTVHSFFLLWKHTVNLR